MKLGEFIKAFIQPNSLIRLVYKTDEGHEILTDNWGDVSMEWEVLENKGIYRHYIYKNVVGITDILVKGNNSEAINVVIDI